MIKYLVAIFIALIAPSAFAETGLPALTMVPNEDGSQSYTITLQVLALMTALSFIPAVLIMMTSFTRIVIVLSILRQAMGLQQAPSNQVVIGLALFLSLFIMSPVLDKINNDAIQPYINDKVDAIGALKLAQGPIREFMLSQTRDSDIKTFLDIAKRDDIKEAKDTPMTILIPAFITSELKTAFQIGFMLFIPFLVIDLVVASVLMAMGMMMLSPMIVSLPFKLMLFVLVDGWALVMGTLAKSFGL